MIVLRSIVFCMVLLISSQPVTLFAADRLEVEIRSTILNIRETMSTKSPVVGILNKGDRILVTTTGHQDWIQLEGAQGFISIHYVDVLSRTPIELSPAEAETAQPGLVPVLAPAIAPVLVPVAQVVPVVDPLPEQLNPTPEEAVLPTGEVIETKAPEADIKAANLISELNTEFSSELNAELETGLDTDGITETQTQAVRECQADSSNTQLTVDSLVKICRKNLQSLTYEACEFQFSLKIQSSCNNNSEINIECSAQAFSTDKNNIERATELSNRHKLNSSESAFKVTLRWFPGDPDLKINKIVLQEDNCLIIP
ncbi:hypothetical protein [Amphritea balenae]|uniref:SH3 domain-containing protein n=1 Tax=Amphritea balenae TaxID=452629 RepID=A0A3P1SPP2_9GAMM|nr:hypothetical protein [Amphritea balenae]RRC98999.1 hypothetical protein EHS89_12590 [Amphritea balenae]GGK63565.1 hypothetical protein GCM10007941_12140 [Amphritea balenae]